MLYFRFKFRLVYYCFLSRCSFFITKQRRRLRETHWIALPKNLHVVLQKLFPVQVSKHTWMGTGELTSKFQCRLPMFHILSYLLRKLKMYRMYTVVHFYFENIQYNFTELHMVQKLKYTNKIGVTSWQLLDKIKSGQQYIKLKRYTLYNLIIFTHFISI